MGRASHEEKPLDNSLKLTRLGLAKRAVGLPGRMWRYRMSEIRSDSGLAAINHALIYYEIAGEGQPFVMIHAGVADHRQWNNEFAYFANRFRVARYDMRGYGKYEQRIRPR